MVRLAASLTMMFDEAPFVDRFEEASKVGFRGVEIQEPYGQSKKIIAERLEDFNLTPVLFNVFPAVGAIPGSEAEFREGVLRALQYCRATGCRQLHCLAGCTDAIEAERTFVSNLRWASEQAYPFGVSLLIEPLNTRDNPGYFLSSSTQARQIIDRVGCENVFLQFDFYHMQIMEGSLAETVRAQLDRIAHFQIGGVPGRHEPDGEQEVNYPYLLKLVEDLGFDGWVGCEYTPRTQTLAGLGWAKPYGIHYSR